MSEQKTLEIPMSDESAEVARRITRIDDAGHEGAALAATRVGAVRVGRRLRWV